MSEYSRLERCPFGFTPHLGAKSAFQISILKTARCQASQCGQQRQLQTLVAYWPAPAVLPAHAVLTNEEGQGGVSDASAARSSRRRPRSWSHFYRSLHPCRRRPVSPPRSRRHCHVPPSRVMLPSALDIRWAWYRVRSEDD